MALDVQRYPGLLAQLPEALRASLGTFDETREMVATLHDRAVESVGPFPVYTIAPSIIEADVDALQSANRVGWRSLITVEGEPAAIADITFSLGASERFDIRGKAAAEAFYNAIRLALRHVEDDRHYDVRLLAIPDVYVSALWLAGQVSIFVPTRLGGAGRPEPQEVDWHRLREQILPLIAAARGPVEFDERALGSPRSGLPRDNEGLPAR